MIVSFLIALAGFFLGDIEDLVKQTLTAQKQFIAFAKDTISTQAQAFDDVVFMCKIAMLLFTVLMVLAFTPILAHSFYSFKQKKHF